MNNLSLTQKSYLAGFLDADGSIYVQAKINKTYKYGYQIAPYIVLFQSKKDNNFEQICKLIGAGYIRERKDGITEYIIGRIDEITEFLRIIEPYVLLKKKQVQLMKKVIEVKKKVKNKKDFEVLIKLVDKFRELNYSKKRKIRTLTP
ncbi:hypothetical protein A3K33_01020 [Candidatus Azambacteria bacterium RIFOXYC1_FULL_41_20]|nr:MAG: Homing endonuclease [Candidatus Azambacteria bacterium GW2011_GWD1_43_18]OGD41122.1 MAG: hypothetical protein A3K28_01025 [Candidatus Azambacteria bacterium RIFOXYB1_FULL_40_33]OGD42497.1 MAG: hypothetical protein A2193_01040 [Candidatus Azambacteria bacterium RIFOXYA1_FULL_42_37]OGD43607.1 MAG: hypothetical protein A3K33_01020 [Candidatus Azambacteria bacterium RIFOXYC1_FULL_41_20]OGD47400.1 MAG: hypothetical protein A3K35_01020 [Candidatus Azambacteria bacterium RIFOXYD1_FULL_42_38]H